MDAEKKRLLHPFFSFSVLLKNTGGGQTLAVA